MKRALWEHQRQAFRFAGSRKHVALFLEMRLGKTLVAIRRLRLYTPRNSGQGLRILIVAPSSALQSWLDDLDMEGEEDIAILVGKRAERISRLQEMRRWNLINREGFLWLPQIAAIPWDCVIVDESQALKNPTAKISKFFARQFRNVPHRWIMTGTPDPESREDYFQQFKFLHGSFMGETNFWKWRERFFNPPDPRFREKRWTAKSGAAAAIRKYIARVSLRIRKEDIAPGIFTRAIHEKRVIDLPPKWRVRYDKMESLFIDEDSSGNLRRETKSIGEMRAWLHDLADGFIDGEIAHKLKFIELKRLFDDLRGESIVVWFARNQALRYAESFLQGFGIDCVGILGATPLPDRLHEFKAFRAGRRRALLLQCAIAETGINLSEASAAIYFSRPWSLQMNLQTEERIQAISRKSAPLILDILAGDTVDEDVYHSFRNKRADFRACGDAVLRAQARHFERRKDRENEKHR